MKETAGRWDQSPPCLRQLCNIDGRRGGAGQRRGVLHSLRRSSVSILHYYYFTVACDKPSLQAMLLSLYLTRPDIVVT